MSLFFFFWFPFFLGGEKVEKGVDEGIWGPDDESEHAHLVAKMQQSFLGIYILFRRGKHSKRQAHSLLKKSCENDCRYIIIHSLSYALLQ